jgi:4-amino-4-deoxychorismate lyase
MFPLFETLKILDGEFHNLPYHQRRFEYSFELHFGMKPFFPFQQVVTVPEEFQKGLVKLRLLYTKDDFKLEFSNYSPRRISTLKVIESNNISYSLKFTDRSQINGLLKQKGDCDDILIVKNGLITDTSIANIVFYYGKKWVTPSTPLLKGTCRDKLLNDGTIKEEKIKINDLLKFKGFCLINAMFCGDLLPTPVGNIK